MKRILLSILAVVALLCLPSEGQSQVPNVANVNADMMSSLSKALGGANPMQTTGAAGSIFSLAKSRLSPDDFGKVAKAVPGLDGLMAAAPPITPPVPAKGLDPLNSAFMKLGLKSDLVSKAIPVVTEFVSKSGGKDLGKLFSGVLK